jgi:hypothetical protein
VRTDIPLAQQMVQASHAALEAGLKDNRSYSQTSSIIIFQIQSELELTEELEYIRSLGIVCAKFFEPYEDMGITAFATLPISEEYRPLFKKYTLWGRSTKGIKTPLTDFLKEEMKSNQRAKKEKVLILNQMENA